MNQRVLVTGASIAGPTLAWWLHHYGFDVTVVERAPEFRDGGQNIDVRGAARPILERMGLLQAVKDHNTGEQGFAYVDEHNEPVAEFDNDQVGGEGLTAELEILRGDLARLLYDHSREQVRYRFGDTIEKVEQTDAGVRVTFAHGEPEQFDLVVAAEGANSSTRQLLFEAEVTRKPYDLYVAYFTIARAAGDGQIARAYNAPGGRGLWLRPDNTDTTRALLLWQHEPAGYENLPVAAQKQKLHEVFADAGWEAPRIVAGLDAADDFYFELVSQVKLSQWTRGRVALTGDAAWCSGPFGVGTTEAIVGSYVLAGELHRHGPDYPAAFAAYEQRLRPYVEKGQDVSKTTPRIFNPQSRLGLVLLRTVLHISAAPGIRQLTTLLASPPTGDIELPDYEQPDPKAVLN
ncbi:FAD-binding monooxygenase [Hymenobacter sp. RP-2-7]|uniref:FAD-binding monooxygenase n=1 Tax=Hymenobacter polaris TaxID=2682546 RepID=A0A7Y0AHK1_9BACT|nr:FAD-dependent monooxygenase [Hymenobacter polaris]NML67508.1 FAD-binding monooxygenase [Hymenobacter polaris]